MDNLPDSILIKILDNLSWKELLEVQLVCKRYNEIVSGSVRLMQKFRVRIIFRDEIQAEPLVNSIRKYQYASLFFLTDCSCSTKEKLYQILKKLNTIKNIEFWFCTLYLRHLTKILKSLPKDLHVISFHNVKVHPEDYDEDELPDFKCLKELKLHHSQNDSFIDLFANSTQLKTITLEKSEINTSVENFLCKQKGLTSMTLNEITNPKMFSNPDLTFKLEELVVEFCRFNNSIAFHRFLIQQNKLKNFSIRTDQIESNVSDLNYILSLQTLERLKVIVGFGSIVEPLNIMAYNSFVTKLSFKMENNIRTSMENFHMRNIFVSNYNHFMYDFLKLFPRITKLDLYVNFNKNVMQIISEFSPLINKFEIKSNIDGEFLPFIALPKMTYFKTDARIDDPELKHFTTFCRNNVNLETLIFKYLYKFEIDKSKRNLIVDIVESVLKELPKLNRFEIDCGDCVADIYLVDLIFTKVAQHGKKLTYLKLRGNFDKMEKWLSEKIVENSPQLKYNLKNWPIH